MKLYAVGEMPTTAHVATSWGESGMTTKIRIYQISSSSLLKELVSASEYYFDLDLIQSTNLMVCAPGDGSDKKITLMDTSLANGASFVSSTAGDQKMSRI